MQTAAWDAATEISEGLDRSLLEVANFVASAATVADDGTDLSQGEVDEMFGIAVLGRTVTAKSSRNSVHEGR